MLLVDWITFVATYLIVAVVPGPSAFFIAGQAARHGRREALKCVLSAKAGDACLLAAACLCMFFAVSLSRDILAYLNWAGIFLLGFLGFVLMFGLKPRGQASARGRSGAGKAAFVIGLTNPKTLTLYSSLLPVFLHPERGLLPQLLVICLTVLAVGVGCLSVYACLSSTRLVQKHTARAGRLAYPASGFLILAMALFLGASI
ncbi:LysE family transporter [Roseibium sp. SCPC15]|uniref:LysE family translocator n=1 Tax=Roseibium sp. SCP15 TaxID=3141376 RepID=UPI003337B8AB